MFPFWKTSSLSGVKAGRPDCKPCSEQYHDKTLWEIVHALTHRIEELEKQQKESNGNN
jgi:hypothetical protein